MRTWTFVLMLAIASAAFAVESPQWATKDPRAGTIGTDTSRVPEFTNLFRSHPEWRFKAVAAFKGGSPNLPTSTDRVEKFAATSHGRFDVEIVGSIEELLQKVDVVLLESVDGQPHLVQATPVLKAGKPPMPNLRAHQRNTEVPASSWRREGRRTTPSSRGLR